MGNKENKIGIFYIFDSKFQLINSNCLDHERLNTIINFLPHILKLIENSIEPFLIKDPQFTDQELMIEAYHEQKSREINYMISEVKENRPLDADILKSFNLDELDLPLVPFIISTEDGQILNYNRSFADLLGYSEKELRSINTHDLYYKSNERSEILSKINSQSNLYPIETIFRKKDGSKFFVSITSRPLYDQKNDIIAYQSRIADLTPVKELENDLVKLSKGIQNSSNLIVITDLNGIIEYVNPMFTGVTEYTAEEVIGKKMNIVSSGHHDENLYKELWMTILNGEVWSGNLKNKKKSGEFYWVSSTIFPIINERKEIINLMAIQQDITDTVDTKNLLFEAQEMIRAIFENAPSGICITDKSYSIISNNFSFTTILETDSSKLEKASLFDFIDSNDQAKLKEISAQRMKRSSFLICKLKTTSKIKTVQLAVMPVFNASNEFQTFVIVIDDLTDQIISSEFQRATKQNLVQNSFMDTIAALSSGLSHDFNNLLSAIIFNTYYIKSKYKADNELVELMDEILDTANKGGQLIKDFITFTKSNETNFRITNVNKLLKDLFSVIKRTFDRRITIELKLCDEELFTMGNEVSLYNSILNLCINARDVMPNGGTLEIRSSVIVNYKNLDSKFIKIEVEDNGPGISEEIKNRIFDPYYTTKDKHPGLGLAIVKHTIEQHLGEIVLANREGSGTNVIIYLPSIEPELPSNNQEKTQLKTKKLSIMIIDDEILINSSFTRLLELEGCNVIHFTNPVDAIEEYSKIYEKIDLIVLDHNLPIMNGIQVLEHLVFINPKVKVIIITGDYSLTEFPNSENILSVIMKPIVLEKFWNIANKITN